MATTARLPVPTDGTLVDTLATTSAPRMYVDDEFGGFHYQLQPAGTAEPVDGAWVPFPPPDFRVSFIPETGEYLGKLFLRSDREGGRVVVLTGEAPA